MRNLAIVGGFAAGKTTLADGLVQQGYVRVSFAKRLKELAYNVYGIVGKGDQVEVTRLDGRKETISGRRVLQELGQAVKELDRDFWIKWMARDVRDLSNYGQAEAMVTDDCRFPYEADALRAMNFYVVKLEVPLDTRIRRYYDTYNAYPTPAELIHPSEIELVNITPDYVINGEKPAGEILREVYEYAKS